MELNRSKQIRLEKLSNTRDLGGIRTMDGHMLVPRRLIRSGALYEASPSDVCVLKEKWNLGTVVDFRTMTERRQKPDPDMDGVENVFNPILDEKTVGITFEEDETTKGQGEDNRDSRMSILEHASSLGADPRQYVDKLYRDLALDSHAAKYYGRFFDILLRPSSKAVLWHCSAGKDRVGVGTALVLYALGVDRESILEDFISTNEYVMDSVMALVGKVEEATKDKRLADCVKVLLTVSGDYLENAFSAMEESCGSVDAYLRERIGLNEGKLSLLRSIYLTE